MRVKKIIMMIIQHINSNWWRRMGRINRQKNINMSIVLQWERERTWGEREEAGNAHSVYIGFLTITILYTLLFSSNSSVYLHAGIYIYIYLCASVLMHQWMSMSGVKRASRLLFSFSFFCRISFQSQWRWKKKPTATDETSIRVYICNYGSSKRQKWLAW